MNVCRRLLFLLVLFTVSSTWGQRPVDIDLRSEGARSATAAALAAEAQSRKEEAWQRARARGWEVRGTTPAGRVFELMHLNERGQPMYYVTMNVQAAISTGANLIRNTAPYSVNGSGLIAGVWDEGAVRPTHQEFTSPNRVVVQDGAPISNHGTHVGGTIGAKGQQSAALGMAPSVTIHSYDWTSDLSEMTAAAATAPNQTNRINVSNHSYGYLTGWENDNISGYDGWHWFGTLLADREDRGFGRYSSEARSWDNLCFNAPYFLPFKAAGNDRNDGPPPSGTTFRFNGSFYTYNPSTHPFGDGHKEGGYNTIGYMAVAKNVMTVGAVTEAVSGGVRNPAAASMSSFSGWGPADDGRIKPDIVANGVSVYSPDAGSNSSYDTYNGTSMATPNAVGSALLLIEHYRNKFPGQDMRAATLKGLIIHTADDMGNPGPDYVYGWGLMSTKAAADHITEHQEQPGALRMTEAVLMSGQTNTYEFTWDGVNPIRATLSWTDPQGPAQSGLNSSTRVLINDLDLRIINPDGTTNFPYVLNPANYTANATFGDNIRDNVEQVFIASPGMSGSFTVRVSHKSSLSGGQQAYSLLLSGSTDQEVPPALTSFEWNTIASPQAAGSPFSVTINARDQFGEPYPDFSGTVALAAQGASGIATNQIGFGTGTAGFPLYTYFEDARTQVIYLQSELGGSARLNGLALDVTQLPPQALNNWTIRMKHTGLTSYATPSLEATGWTTVYQAHTTISQTGWVWFPFSQPFDYNGSDNLMIDFSFNNATWSSEGASRVSSATARTVYAASDSDHGDPSTWTGTSNPTTYTGDFIPNIRLLTGQELVISPTVSGNFVNGVWTGSVAVQDEASSISLRATQGAASGDSNPFDVIADGPPPNYGMRDDGGVNLPTLTYWHDGLGPDITEQGASFARDLGTRTALYLKGAAIKVWKSGEGDVTGTRFEYKLWEQGQSEPGSYTVRSVGWTSNDGGGDQTWANFGNEINIIDGLSPGTYSLKVLFTVQGTGVPGILTNGPHTATFQIAAPPPPDAPLGQPPTNIGETSFTANWIGFMGATNYLLDVGTTATFSQSSGATYVVDFETSTSGNKTAYASGTVLLSGYSWNMTEALIGTLANDWKMGARSARLRGYATSSMTLLEDRAEGIGEISFSYRRYGSDAQVDWRVDYSTNSGSAWIPIGSSFTAPASDAVQNFSEFVNVPGPVRVRIRRATDDGNTSDRRLNIDNLVITAYNAPTYVPGYEARSVGDVSAYPVTGLDPSTDYYYRLRAQNEYGVSGYSDVRMATTLTPAPAYTTNSPVAVPFAWLEQYFGGGIDHEAVAVQVTGSGMTVWQEYVAGTDPTDPESRLEADVIPPEAGEYPMIQWLGTDQPNRTYSIYRTTNLNTPMTLLMSGIPSFFPVLNVYTDTTYEVTAPAYYRIRVTLEE